MKLSSVQAEALYSMREHGALSEFSAAMCIGKSRNQTLRALQRAGLARYFPTPEHWKLTRAGKEWLWDEDARRESVEYQSKIDAIVARYHDSAKENV